MDGSGLLESVAASSLQCGAPAARHEGQEGCADPHLDSAWEDVTNEIGRNVSHGLVVRLEAEDVKTQRKQPFTQGDKDMCKLMHRAHIMCLLARGVLLDSIADDPLLQSVVFSHVPNHLVDQCIQNLTNCSISLLKALTIFFEKAVNLRTYVPIEDTTGVLEDTNLMQHYFKKAETLTCSVEECTVLFASLLRALGYPVRLVVSLKPMALKPADLVKQISKEYRSQTRKIGRRTKKAVSTLCKPAQETAPKIDMTPQVKKRKCETEFERELALAMEVTSWKVSNVGIDDKMEPEHSRFLKKRATENDPKPILDGLGAHWLEVFCGDARDGKWVHCDPINGNIDSPDDVELKLKKSGALVYVVAFAGRGAKDVTRRYCSNISSIKKHRDNEWWDQTISLLRRNEQMGMRKALAKSFAMEDDSIAANVDHRENKELEKKSEVAKSAMPTTIEGFKNHDQLILKRHINKYQILVPGSKVVGAHKGEPFYLKKDLRDIHTAERWKRLGREVKQAELDFPCKMIKKRGAPSAGIASPVLEVEGDIGIDEMPMSRYYAEWQTESWCPPAAVDGKVPKNDRGNVEIPPFAFQMPHGTVHVDLPNAAKVCKKLQIDFAPALTGFDIRGGRSVPRIEGIVVCEEYQDVVLNACHEYMKHQAELAKQKRLKEGEGAWRDFVRALLTHTRVLRSYAGDDMPLQLLESASLKKDPSEKTAKGTKTESTSAKSQVSAQDLDQNPTSLLDVEEI